MASRTRRFFLNSLSLCLSALIMRGVGVAFNIYVSSRAGTVTMGLYSLSFGAYGFFVTLACFGINLGVTRLISDALGENNIPKARRSMRISLISCALTGAIATAVMFILSPYLAELLGDTRCELSLRAMALSLFPIAVCSCISGYFTAVRRVKVSSAVLTAIQIFKIFITLGLLYIFMPYGDEYACLSLVLGLTVCEIISLLVSYVLYLYDSKKHLSINEKNYVGKNEGLSKKLISITLPVTVASCLRSLLGSLSHILIPKGLKKSGSSWESALSSYGLLQSVVLPLVLFPSAFISCYSGLLIPEVSQCRVQRDYIRLSRISYRILTFALFFSIGVSGIMTFLATDIGNSIYSSTEAGKYIRLLAPLIPIMYIDSSVDAILKGMGKQVYSMVVNILDAGSACIIIFLLVPRLGLHGYIISIYATEILNTTLSLVGMIKCAKPKLRPIHQVFLPILCICGATALSNIILRLIYHPFSPMIELILHICLVICLYGVFMLLTNAIGSDEKEVIYQSLAIKNRASRK